MSINVPSTTAFIPDVPNINVVENTADEEIICRWHVNEFVVYLIKEHDSIKYKTLDRDQKEIYTNCIGIPESKSLEQRLSHLKQCMVMVDENGITRFLKVYSTWTHGDTEISLVRKTEDLAWNIFNKTTNKSSFLDLKKDTISSLQCHPRTVALIEKIKNEALSNKELLKSLMSEFEMRVIDPEEFKSQYEELRKILLEFNGDLTGKTAVAGTVGIFGIHSLTLKAVTTASTYAATVFGNGSIGSFAIGALNVSSGLFSLGGGLIAGAAVVSYFYPNIPYIQFKKIEEKIETLPPESPLLIEIKPISAPSRIDKRVHVSKFTWAVTLVTHRGSEGNHAIIIVEGINDGYYGSENPRIKNGWAAKNGEKFTYMAEFSPPIKSQLFSSKKELLYETRTEIWMRTSSEVKKMLEDIEEQKLCDLEYNSLGMKSKFYKFALSLRFFSPSRKYGDNCFTWARDKLKILNIDLGEGYLDYLVALSKNYTRNKEEYEILPVEQLI